MAILAVGILALGCWGAYRYFDDDGSSEGGNVAVADAPEPDEREDLAAVTEGGWEAPPRRSAPDDAVTVLGQGARFTFPRTYTTETVDPAEMEAAEHSEEFEAYGTVWLSTRPRSLATIVHSNEPLGEPSEAFLPDADDGCQVDSGSMDAPAGQTFEVLDVRGCSDPDEDSEIAWWIGDGTTVMFVADGSTWSVADMIRSFEML